MVRRFHNRQLYRILAISADISRLSSHANVLTQAGYNADLFFSIDQAVRRAQVQHYDLAIVSNTFTREEQIAIRARLKRVRQNLPVLLWVPEHDLPDALLDAVANRLNHTKNFQFGTRLDGIHLDHSIR